MKVLKGTPKHLSKTETLSKFTYLMMTLPFQCNYRCLKCFNLEGDTPLLSKSSGEHISLTDRIELINEAKKLGGKVVVIAGEGEPSLDKNIKPIISEIHSLGMTSIVYSNGSTLTNDLIDFYKENNTVLVIAFDSLESNKYGRLTGTKGQHEIVMKHIKNTLKSYRDVTYFEDGLNVLSVAINTTITSENQDEVEKIKIFWGDDVYFICNPLSRSGNAIGNWDKLIQNNEEKKDCGELAKRLSESGGPLTLGIDNCCGYSVRGIGVNPFGDYMTCAFTQETNGLLGNIRNLSLENAFKMKHKLESEHYIKYGEMPCLVREKSFDDYLSKLKYSG